MANFSPLTDYRINYINGLTEHSQTIQEYLLNFNFTPIPLAMLPVEVILDNALIERAFREMQIGTRLRTYSLNDLAKPLYFDSPTGDLYCHTLHSTLKDYVAGTARIVGNSLENITVKKRMEEAAEQNLDIFTYARTTEEKSWAYALRISSWIKSNSGRNTYTADRIKSVLKLFNDNLVLSLDPNALIGQILMSVSCPIQTVDGEYHPRNIINVLKANPPPFWATFHPHISEEDSIALQKLYFIYLTALGGIKVFDDENDISTVKMMLPYLPDISPEYEGGIYGNEKLWAMGNTGMTMALSGCTNIIAAAIEQEFPYAVLPSDGLVET